jgi:hypothetical protein
LSAEELAALNPKTIDENDSTAQNNESNIAEENVFELANSPYKINESQTHIFVITMEPGQASAAKNLLGDLENFHAKNFSNARLRTGNMNMNRENSSCFRRNLNQKDLLLKLKSRPSLFP